MRAIDVKQRRLDSGYYYGHPNDVGTPDHVSDGALPVELSDFKPIVKNDEVVIEWTTASEFNNAGFNIFRKEIGDDTFIKLNAQLIPGAETTSSRRSYSFTDKSAKVDVAYMYQIQDVSYDGEYNIVAASQLRGVISASGKLTVKWAEVKSK